MDLLNHHSLVSDLPFLRKIGNRANCWLIWLNLKLWTRDTKLNRRHGLSSTTRFPVKRDAGSCKLSLPDLLLIPLGMKFVCQKRVHEVRRCSITPCYFPSRDPQSKILSALFPISASNQHVKESEMGSNSLNMKTTELFILQHKQLQHDQNNLLLKSSAS